MTTRKHIPLNTVVTKASLVAASAANKNYSYSACQAIFDGEHVDIAAQAATPVATEDALTKEAFKPIKKDHHCLFALFVDEDGADHWVQGDVKPHDGLYEPTVPPNVDGALCIGTIYVHVDGSVNNAVETWTFGVGNWNATGLKRVIKNLAGTYPSRIQRLVTS